MASTIKGLVSRKKKRYKEDGFNLDLTYIFDNVIAMGYPAASIEGVYRNHINDVSKFLEMKHKDHYKIYNLCSERSYDCSKFHDRVSSFPFEDHNPPRIELIQPFCEDVDSWLNEDPQNVAVVHCKAGKGRTGVMICCYILHRGWADNADEALKHYGKTRTHDTKGVTIPSQRRYVEYYDQILKAKGPMYSVRPLVLRELRLEPVPSLSGGCVPVLTVFEAISGIPFTPSVELHKSGRVLRIILKDPLVIKGDVRITLKNKPNVMMIKEKMFHFWFNTFFVNHPVRLPPSPLPPVRQNIDENVPANGLDSTASLTKAEGLAFKLRWQGLFDRSDRTSNGTSNHLNPNVLSTSSRASSLNSVYSDNAPTSESTRWLSFTLNKQDLDKACKDEHHKIYAADFKVTLFFTQPCQNQVHLNTVGSLPNMETGIATTAITSVSPVPRTNTANRVSRPKTIASTVKSTPKPHSPQNIGLVGPICWRRTGSSKDLRDGQHDHLDGVKGRDRLPRHSDSSHTFSSEENDASDLDQSDHGLSQKNLFEIHGHVDEEQDSCSSSDVAGRYEISSFPACTFGGSQSKGHQNPSLVDPKFEG